MNRALREGFSSLRREPLVQALAIGTIAVSLMLVGVVRLMGANVGRLARSWGQGVQATVYLEDGVSPARTRKINDAIAKLPGVISAVSVDSHEAFVRLKQGLGDRAALLDGVDETLLPVSIEVTLADGTAGALRLQPEFDRLRKTPGVEDVELMGDWVNRLAAVERLLSLADLVLAALVGGACLYVVASTIRLGVFSRREEIEILKLVGATDGFVKAPFLVEGAVQGLVGALLAIVFLYLIFLAAVPSVEHSLGGTLLAIHFVFLSPLELCSSVILGGALGLAGSSVSVNRHIHIHVRR